MSWLVWVFALLGLLVLGTFFVSTMPTLQSGVGAQKQEKIQYESWGSPSKTMRHPK